MSITPKHINRLLPLMAEKPVRNKGNLVYPPIKKTLMARPVDKFKTKKVQNEANALGLGPETNPVRTARSFKTFVRTSKERVTRLEKTIKGNETLLKACKGLTEVSGPLAPDGLADLITSTWSKQKHVISQLKNDIQELKESPKDSLIGHSDESIMGLARMMDVDTTPSQTSTMVSKMKVTFINLKDMVKVKEEKIQNLRDREKTKTKRIVELQNELDNLQTKNLDLALDLQEAQDKRQTADNRVFDFETKIRDLETDIEKKTCENEDLLQRYEEAGEVVLGLQTDLDETKQNNESLNLQIKDLQAREFKKDDHILTLEKDLANLNQMMNLDSKSEDDFMKSKLNQSALKLQKISFDQELKNLRSDGHQRDYYVLKLEQDIGNMQKEKDELYQEIQNSFSKDRKTNHREDELKQEIEELKEERIEQDLKLKDTISKADEEIFESKKRVSEVQVQKIELDSKLKVTYYSPFVESQKGVRS
ncbi:spindle pole body component 110-like [Strongylocentrotus purpuratus]|uniref:Uncharacterized protein n=1 Tax=Strongylocentrotus purpuratus TaxID=7668 RepID=A0A7M7NAV2_STRPU|nr:spindle pole body component 110-like [Strongylocentrotus purpuratus]